MTAAEPQTPRAARGADDDGAAWAWSVYWRTDHLHACVPVSNPRHLAAIEARWASFFETLGDEARIVDLGTGNGSLAVMAAKFAAERGRRFEIHGVDAAGIDPARRVSAARELIARIRFHPHTRIERLPFEDDGVDAVCGQFAIEYAEPHEAVAEVMRVLAPGRRFGFLLHARDGALMERAVMHRDQARRLRRSGILDRLARLFETMAATQGKATTEPADRLRAERESFEADLRGWIPWLRRQPDTELPLNFLRAVERLYRAAPGLAAAERTRLLRDLETRLAAREARVAAMIEAALDEPACARLAAMFERAGARVEERHPFALGEDGPVLGWWLSGRA